MRIVMAPYSTQTVPYSVVPLAPGTLSVTGCILTLPDGIRRVAPLPSATADAAQGTKRERHRSRGAPGERTALGLRPTLALPEPSDDSHRADINVSVVRPQPMLVVKSTSLTHGSVIVYEGESTAVTIHVENLSDTPITYIELRFDDNTAEAAREKLADDSNTTESRYNIERELLDRPVIRWQRPDDPRIPPRGASGLVVECLGKAGWWVRRLQACWPQTYRLLRSESAIVEIEYGTDVGDVRYTRQIICPILLTVRPTLQVVAAAITPLESMGVQSSLSPAMAADNALDSPTGLHATPGNLQRRSSSYCREAESDTQLADAIAKAQKAGLSCLLQVDVCNAFPSPLEGFLARKTGDGTWRIMGLLRGSRADACSPCSFFRCLAETDQAWRDRKVTCKPVPVRVSSLNDLPPQAISPLAPHHARCGRGRRSDPSTQQAAIRRRALARV